MGEHETALSLAHRYLSESEEIRGENAQEIAHGIFLLYLIYGALHEFKEKLDISKQRYAIRGRINDTEISHDMMENLYGLALAHQGQGDYKNAQRAFLIALLALFISRLGSKAIPRDFVKRISNLLQSLGFPQDFCGWLTRRCQYITNDLIGLVSVLIEQGLFPSETEESDKSSRVEVDAETITTKYEIVLMEDSDWKLPEGFSKEFPASVAEGELSMRVERLLEEGCRCLETTGDLTNVWLVFSSCSTGRRITVFGADTWSDENADVMEETLRRKAEEAGADSVMMLVCVDLRCDKAGQSLGFLRAAYDDKAVTVMARDAKGAVAGMLPANLIEGKYVFEEPIVTGAEEDCLAEFTFPVQPGAKVPGPNPADKNDLTEE
jgi:hypothetical protein